MNRFEMVMAELRRVWPMDAKVISDHIAARDATITQLRAELERVKGLGSQMANVMYNAAQVDSVPVRLRNVMDSLRREWDGISSVVDGAGGEG